MRRLLVSVLLFLSAATCAATAQSSKQLLNVCHDTSDLDRAIKACTQIIERGGDPEDLIKAYTDRGEYFLHRKQLDRAISDYTKAIEIKPDNAWSYLERGGAFESMGRNKRAVDDYGKALELDPGGPAGDLAFEYTERLVFDDE